MTDNVNRLLGRTATAVFDPRWLFRGSRCRQLMDSRKLRH